MLRTMKYNYFLVVGAKKGQATFLGACTLHDTEGVEENRNGKTSRAGSKACPYGGIVGKGARLPLDLNYTEPTYIKCPLP